MARKQQVRQKPAMAGKFYIYLGSFAIFGCLILFTYIMGFDIGIARFGGELSPEVALWVLPVMLLLEYIVDVRYCKRLRYLQDMKPTALDYVPYVNVSVLFDKWVKWSAVACVGIALISLLFSMTPAVRLFGMTNLDAATTGFTITLIVSFIAFCVLRGWEHAQNKKVMMTTYNQMSEFGSGGKISALRYAFYFIPVIRCVNILNDAQFAETVKMMLDLDEEIESGE